MAKLKIAQITMHFLPIAGGQETYINSLNHLFRANDIDVSIFQPYKRQSGQVTRDTVYMLPPLPKIYKYIKGLDWFWFNYMLLLYKNKLNKYDILICHYPFHYPSIKWHKNIIVVSHGLDFPPIQKNLFDKHKKRAIDLVKYKVKIVANDTNFLRYLGYNVAPGSHLFEKVASNTWFIPNCVDLEKFKYNGEIRSKTILVPRNIRKERGIILAINSYNLFNKMDSNYQLHIIGGPLSGEYYNSCVNIINEYLLGEKIKFIGSVSYGKMQEYYNKAFVTLIPSLAFEGTSLSALESMACKTPVVSTYTGGLSDLPTLKAPAKAEYFSDLIKVAIDNWDYISEKQYNETSRFFNLKNWEEAWIKLVKSS